MEILRAESDCIRALPPALGTSLRQPFPPPGGGLCRRARPFILKVTAEISVIAQISVIQVTVVSCVSVQKSAILLPKPPPGGGKGWRRLVPSAGGRARIEWVYDTNAATKFATLHKKAGICSKSNKFLLFSCYFRIPMSVFFDLALSQLLFQSFSDRLQKLQRVDRCDGRAGHDKTDQILGHDAVVKRL